MSGIERVVSFLVLLRRPANRAREEYESANLRLSNVLATLVSEVDLLPYPQTSGSQNSEVDAICTRAFSVLFKRILVLSGRNAAIHFTPYCRHFLGVEAASRRRSVPARGYAP